VNYRSLIAANLLEAAALFEETERTKTDVLVACGVRVAYEGNGNENVVTVRAAASFDRPFAKIGKTLFTHEIFFTTPEGLYYELLKITSPVLDLF